MKYLVNELYTKCFYGKEYDKNQDKFVIGYRNQIGNKLKDVITGQVVESDYFEKLSDMVDYPMTLGYMTGLDSNSATIKQQILARYIDKTILKNDVLDSKQIAKIKNIMNKEIVASHEKDVKKQNAKAKYQEEINQYKIDESDKQF